MVDSVELRYLHLLTEQAMSFAWAGQLTESQEVAARALECRPAPAVEAQIRLGVGRSLLAQGRGHRPLRRGVRTPSSVS